MDYCFDTSAVNRLHDDASKQAIILGLLSANRVLVSELNLIEVMTTADVERRVSLCLLLKQLARGVRPLLTPTTLLRKLTIAYLNNQPTADITDDGVFSKTWCVLQRPEKYADEDARQFFYQEKREIEDRFTKAHRVGRTQFPDLYPPGERPRSLGQTLRFFCRNPLSFFATTAVLYESIAHRALPESEMRQLFIDLPEWPLFLAGWAQGLYARALQHENFGARRNVGTIDLWFALYLENCDFLVTDDTQQYQALRVIRCLAGGRHKKARVMLYDQFRARLVL